MGDAETAQDYPQISRIRTTRKREDHARELRERHCFLSSLSPRNLIKPTVLRHAWGDIARCYNCHSIRKSLLSALYGLHLEEARLSLERTLAELGIDDLAPGLSEQEKQATVRELLQSRSGVYHEASYETE